MAIHTNSGLKLIFLVLLFLSACSSLKNINCSKLQGIHAACPDESTIFSQEIRHLYAHRSWVAAHNSDFDPIEMGIEADIPIQVARTKIIGPFGEGALRSLAAKLWMIENARHTIDIVYYIFKFDRVGSAVLGALCDAVQRGVDIRIMVDAIGSFQVTHNNLRALESCANNAALMLEADGSQSPHRARIQAAVINAIGSSKSRINRRSHDKLLVSDGHFPKRALVMTGGRNISLDYYGINKDGSPDPNAFQDAEILLRPARGSKKLDNVVAISELYYTLLFAHKGNREVKAITNPDGSINSVNRSDYERILKKANNNLEFFKTLPAFRAVWADMPGYMNKGFNQSEVRLAHELSNLTNPGVLSNVAENFQRNPNSITYQLYELSEKSDNEISVMRIVSPYLFVALYTDKKGDVLHDGAENLFSWLNDRPNTRVEIITNSVLTSDNFMAQSIIDMDMAPRLLLPRDMQEQWLELKTKKESDSNLVTDDHWQKLIKHPRLAIYQSGKLDAIELGGSVAYGKLHAKFMIFGNAGFLGTSNFDYRSRLLNNEFGYFFRDQNLHQDLLEIFENLKQNSNRWGTGEWLEMRKALMANKGVKAMTTRNQRRIYRFLRFWNLKWLI